MTATINVSLKKDRTRLGSAELIAPDGSVLAGPFPCLAISDNAAATAARNPTHDPLHTDGNLPTGTFRCTIIAAGLPTHSYGPGLRIELIGIAGDALRAAQNGRSGLLDHGGDLNPTYTQWDGLRPTIGCLRFKNEDLATLIAALAGYDEILQVVTET